MTAPTGDTGASVFDDHVSSWTAWQQEPWARVRYAVVAHVLDRHLAALPGSLRVLDVGGGDGRDSLRLAAQGHEVTILDYSGGMLDLARDAACAEGVADRVHLVKGAVGALSELAHRDFDAVLCHFVIGYVADSTAAVESVVSAARPGGLVSLIASNPVSDVLTRAVRGKDALGALEMIDDPAFHAVVFSSDVRRVEWRAAARALRGAGADVLGRYGCRAVIDLLNDDAYTSDPARLADVIRLEIAVSARSPYRDIARAWQLIARRR